MKALMVAFAAVGGYLVWRNRFAIQQKMESVGIKTPLLNNNVGEAVHSLTSKISGEAEHGIKKTGSV